MFINKMIILIIFKISVLGHCLYMGNDLWYKKVNTVSSYFTQMTLEIWQVKVNFYEFFFKSCFVMCQLPIKSIYLLMQHTTISLTHISSSVYTKHNFHPEFFLPLLL